MPKYYIVVLVLYILLYFLFRLFSFICSSSLTIDRSHLARIYYNIVYWNVGLSYFYCTFYCTVVFSLFDCIFFPVAWPSIDSHHSPLICSLNFLRTVPNPLLLFSSSSNLKFEFHYPVLPEPHHKIQIFQRGIIANTYYQWYRSPSTVLRIQFCAYREWQRVSNTKRNKPERRLASAST